MKKKLLLIFHTFQSNYSDDEEPEEYRSHRRTSSCPDLSIYRPNTEPPRKRAQSLFHHVDDGVPDFLKNLHRVHSENDVNNVEPDQPFNGTTQQMQPTDLLARVFTALGNIKAADDEAQSSAAMNGINGFSDSQILATEKNGDSNWSIPFSESSFSVPPLRARGRAASDFRAPLPDQLKLELNDSHDWTWSGNNQQIEEFMRLRRLNKRKQPDLYRAAFTLPKTDNSVVLNVEDGMSPQTSTMRARSASIFGKWNPFKKRDESKKISLPQEQLDVKSYLDRTAAGRASRLNVTQMQNSMPSFKRRASTFSILSGTDGSNADVLENTTIADLIRALEVMHTQAETGDNPLLENLLNAPRSRVGSMSQNLTIQSNLPQPTLPLINVFPATPKHLRDRRGSLRPFSSANTPQSHRASRRPSAIVDLPSRRRSSLLVPPSTGPPPYSEATPRLSHRRFSVRPTLLSIPPGQSPMPSIQATSSLQKRLSMRPSPLVQDNTNFNFNLNPIRVGRSISTSSSYSSSPLETSPLPIHNTLLAPVNENLLNIPHSRRKSPSQLFSTNTDLTRKRSKSESK